jgi:hypothetical protein
VVAIIAAVAVVTLFAFGYTTRKKTEKPPLPKQ